MAVHLCFDKGAIGTAHTHEVHDQIGYVVRGGFKAAFAGHTVAGTVIPHQGAIIPLSASSGLSL